MQAYGPGLPLLREGELGGGAQNIPVPQIHLRRGGPWGRHGTDHTNHLLRAPSSPSGMFSISCAAPLVMIFQKANVLIKHNSNLAETRVRRWRDPPSWAARGTAQRAPLGVPGPLAVTVAPAGLQLPALGARGPALWVRSGCGDQPLPGGPGPVRGPGAGGRPGPAFRPLTVPWGDS